MNFLTYRYLRVWHRIWNALLNQFTSAGLGVLVGLGIAGVAALGSTQSLSPMLICFGVALLGSAQLSRRFIQYEIRAVRTLPRFGTVGESFQYAVTLHNLTAQAQSGLQLVETFPDGFPSFHEFSRIKAQYSGGSRWILEWRDSVARQRWAIAVPQDLPVLAAETKTKARAEVIPLRRGRLSFEALAFNCPDPLGLTYKRWIHRIPQSVCILPRRYHLPPLNLPSTKRYQRGETSLVSSIGEALEFRSLRDYRPGDPTRKIHWKSWAKVGRPIVKEQQDETAAHHGLLLDTFQSDTQTEYFEAALAIAISFLTKEHPEEVLLDVMYAAPTARCVTVGRGLRHRGQILETLATLAPCQAQNLHQLTPILDHHSRLSGLFCIFTGFDEARSAFLNRLVQSGISTKAIVLYDHLLPPEKSSYFLGPQCCIHWVSLNSMQQDLWQI